MSDTAIDDDIIPTPFRRSARFGVRDNRHSNAVLSRRLFIYKLKFSTRTLFHLSGFVAMNGLATLGAYMLFFIVIGNAQPSGFFAQIAEVSRRYLQASAERQTDFLLVMCAAFAALFVLVSAVRAVAFRDRVFGVSLS